MKRLFISILMVAIALGSFAQTDSTDISIDRPLPRMWQDSYRYGMFGPWLHQGLNVKLDLSAFATFGHHAHHGGGFGQSLSATWLQPVNDKLWVATGGRLSNIIYGGDSYRDGSLYLMAGYRFNERWEAYIFAEKTLTNNHAPRFRYDGWGYGYGGIYGGYDPLMHSLMPYDAVPADRIGAAVRYNFSPTCSMEVSVQGIWPRYDSSPYLQHPSSNTHQYNYPIGENY